VLQEVVSEDDIWAAAQSLVEQARAGDLAAIKLLFAYAIGKPVEAVDPDRVDVDEWQLTREQGVPPEAMSAVLRTLPADWVVKLLRIAWPCVAATLSEQVQQGIAEQEREERAAAASRTEAMPSTEPFGNGTNGEAAGPDGGAERSPEAGVRGKRPVISEVEQRADGQRGRRIEENAVAAAWPADGLEDLLVPAEMLDLLVAQAERPMVNGDNGSERRGPPGVHRENDTQVPQLPAAVTPHPQQAEEEGRPEEAAEPA
jgi:hypothetical protein